MEHQIRLLEVEGTLLKEKLHTTQNGVSAKSAKSTERLQLVDPESPFHGVEHLLRQIRLSFLDADQVYSSQIAALQRENNELKDQLSDLGVHTRRLETSIEKRMQEHDAKQLREEEEKKVNISC